MAESSTPQLLVDTSTPPDVMNDPQYDANPAIGEDGNTEADYCRICRGEGSDAEPLFHPCKCNGSIKHVHQDCLMEWLSHSQKKHCELCKTPFRFTKLYSPNMPPSLPTGVFVRHFALHSLRNFATWLRFCLVIFVWLGILPYMIRQVWSLLFWFSDGAGPTKYIPNEAALNSKATKALEQLRLAKLPMTGTSPATPLQAVQTNPASMGAFLDKLIELFTPASQPLNISSADPLAGGLFKAFLGAQGLAQRDPVLNATSQFITQVKPPEVPTLLSEVSFLKNLTRSASVNRLVISIFEGYIITILVVVSFILVFLIREWVVQQQPGINMGAGFNAEFAPADRIDEVDQVDVEREQQLQPLIEARDNAQRPIARARRRQNPNLPDEDAQQLPPPNVDTVVEGEERRNNRPAAPRDALTPAADIQRKLTEEPRMTEEFLAIWRRADSDPNRVLEIIEMENKGDQMRYWVNAMKLLQTPALPKNLGDPPLEDRDGVKVQSNSEQGSSSGDSGESWVDVVQSDGSRLQDTPRNSQTPDSHSEEISNSKGKGRANQHDEPSNLTSSPSRLPPPDTVIPHTTENVIDRSLPTVSRTRSRSLSDTLDIPNPVSDPESSLNGYHPTKAFSKNHRYAIPEEIEPQDSTQQVYGGESAATFQGAFDFPPNPFNPSTEDRDPTWKATQDLRVQQAIARGREVQKASQSSSVGQHVPPTASSSNSNVSPPYEGPILVHGEDGKIRTATSMEAFLDNNPMSSDSDNEQINTPEDPEANPFAPDVPLPAAREPVVARPAEPQGWLAFLADWLWDGEAAPLDGEENDEHIVEDLENEAPFVPVAHRGEEAAEEDAQPDMEVVEAAIAAGLDPNDPDAIEDAEDFEGFMELIGMRGPVFSLVQNALFSALLLALTVAAGIWLPYEIGRLSLFLIANFASVLKTSLRFVFSAAALLQDVVLSISAAVIWCILQIFTMPVKLWASCSGSPVPSYEEVVSNWSATTLLLSRGAADRFMDGPVASILNIAESEISAFSAASHESLLAIKKLAVDIVEETGRIVLFLFVGDYSVTISTIRSFIFDFLKAAWSFLLALPNFLSKRESWVISLEVSQRAAPLDLDLSVWGGMDRFWAILAGYSTLGFIGALYIRKGSPFSSGEKGKEVEASIIDVLNQAGGVMKVILIISIEMLVFPLYCGLLLDAALLPLFDEATILSRIIFTANSPLTSIFVHWFVGTCYMFHFALFVSMCRKIMRKGVLYFIRDPDDPTFHPVRDVLERNVTTQLRKILFSALVYGALVVICLGGVVWGLAFAFNSVLPIHWSSNEPVLEFPIDLLFYNFLMPLAVKFFKPSDGLHAMYKWWFQQCARMLRLTWFMFDERKIDEEGHVVRRSWRDFFRSPADLAIQLIDDNEHQEDADSEAVVYVHKDGRYVRAPASDQVRIPKDSPIFLDVDEENNRLDGRWDNSTGVHGRGNELYKQVYIPPNFRLRICAFIISVWLFAALTGVCITIVPLVFGRHVFSILIPSHVRKNDVYAFSIGIYILGSALYVLLHSRHLFAYLKSTLSVQGITYAEMIQRLKTFSARVVSILWTYSAIIFLLPTLFAFLFEFYVILPLHTYFAPLEPHTIHFVQSWTLGLLYVKISTRIIQLVPDSRPAISLTNVFRDGYLKPDARLATRSFIAPATFFITIALIFPWCMALFAINTFHRDAGPEMHTMIHRYAYPAVLAGLGILMMMDVLMTAVTKWRMRIRDEVYLIGERLHNFGERKAGAGDGGVRAGLRRIET